MMQDNIFLVRHSPVGAGADGARGPRGRTFVEQPDPIVLRGRRGSQGVAGEAGRRGRAGFNVTEPYLMMPRKGTRGPRGRVLLQQEDALVFERRVASVTQQYINVKRPAQIFAETKLPFRGKQGKAGVGWPGPRGKPALSPPEPPPVLVTRKGTRGQRGRVLLQQKRRFSTSARWPQ